MNPAAPVTATVDPAGIAPIWFLLATNASTEDGQRNGGSVPRLTRR